jgi:hypothetical protein
MSRSLDPPVGYRLGLIVAASLAGACTAPSAADAPNEPPAKMAPPAAAASAPLEGTIRYIEVGTGCWAIETANDRLEPLSLDAAFRKDGLAVLVTVQPAPDMASICQVGRLVRIVSIRAR